MGNGPQLVVRGALLMSIVLSIMCFQLTTGITPVAGSADDETISSPVTSDLAVSEPESNPPEASEPFESPPSGIECRVNSSYPANILQWCELITAYSEKNGFSPDLIAAVMLQESGGNPTAYSRSGAVGLMQVMPRDGLAASFMCKNGPCFASRPTIAELQDPEYNLDYATRMLAGLVARNNSLREGLKSYGPMDVGYYYADKVLAIYERYRQD